MAWMPRSLSALMLALGFLTTVGPLYATDAPVTSTPDMVPFVSLARIVVAGEDKTWGSGIQMDTYVDDLVYAVGAEHGWTPKNAMWPEVAAHVRADIDQHPDLFLQARKETTTQDYASSYATDLTAQQAKDIAALYQSDAGQKYLAFSDDVLNFYLTIMRRGRDEGAQGATSTAMINALRAPVSQDERILLAAGTRYMVSGMGGSQSTPGAAPLTRQRMALNMAAKGAPGEWDALFARYQRDMPAIERVANDSLTRLEMDHASTHGGTSVKAMAPIQSYLASWKAFYWTAKAKRLEAAPQP